MAKINKQFTKFIFPFQYDKAILKPQDVRMQSNKGKELCVFEAFTQSADSLREGLELLMDKDGGSTKIADCYSLNVNCRAKFSLPARKGEYLDFVYRQSGSDPARVAITEVNLYLFESEVGFAELECEYETDSVEKYIELNYFIGEVKSDRNFFVSHEKKWNADTKTSETVDHKFTVKELWNSIFDSISGGEGVQLSFNNGKALIFSHILTDDKPCDLDDVLNHLHKNYKSSYKFDDSSSSAIVFRPFENSYWTGSLNGVSNLSYLTNDEITDDFFEHNFFEKTKRTYYFLFLNVLHQRYAVTRIMGQMGHLDRLEHNYHVMKSQLKEARKYEADAINLKFRAFFKCPSTIEHINEYYDMLCSSFKIDSLYDSFSSDIKSLQSICGQYVNRINERDAKFKQINNARIEILVALFGSIVAEVTLLNSSWSLIEKMLGHTLSFFSPSILILFATMLSPMITIALNIKKQLNNIASWKSEISEEENDRLVEDDKARKKRSKLLKRKKDK